MGGHEEEQKFTQSMAAAFFDITPIAFRHKEQKGHFVNVENEDVTPERDGGSIYTDNGGYKHRKYSLVDLRRIAHALRANDKLSDRQLRIVIMRIDAFSEPLKVKGRQRLYKRFNR